MNILMTGASGAIGQKLAQSLAKEGHSILLIVREESVGEALLQSLQRNADQQHLLIVADINHSSCRQKIEQQIKAKQLDMLINLAGINQFAQFSEQLDQDIEKIIQTNVISAMLLTKQLLTHFSEHQKATIINVGSTLGAIGHPGYVAYCTSKFALRGFSEALDRELADSSIQVKYFAPRTTQSTINSEQAVAMNKTLGNTVDSVDLVVNEFMSFIKTPQKQRYLGWPEKLFVKVNAVFPCLVSMALKSKLAKIKQYI
ncbi:MAG: SDR family oxidoreductase [Oceanospirillaceae bacterium]